MCSESLSRLLKIKVAFEVDGDRVQPPHPVVEFVVRHDIEGFVKDGIEILGFKSVGCARGDEWTDR